MQVSISSRNFDITPAIQAKIENAVAASITDKNLKISSVRVVTEKEKINFKVTITVNTKGHDFVSTVDDDDDLYRAIDKAVGKIENQMAKAVDKIKDIHHDNVKINDVLDDK